MPNRWPINSGSWSDPLIWSGSIIPTASDDVWTNGFNIIIDQDITSRTLRNHAVTSPVIAGAGSFIVSGSYTITCTLPLSGGAGNLGAQSTVYGGFITYGSVAFPTVPVLITTGSNNTININSDIMGTINSPNSSIAIRNTGIVNITGSLAGYSGPAVLIDQGNTGIVNISGSILGNYIRIGGGAASYGLVMVNAGVYRRLNIIGDVIGETGSFANALVVTNANADIYITGSVFTKPTTTNIAITLSGGTYYRLDISGSVRAGGATAINSNGINGIYTIRGPVSASISASAIQSTNTSATNLFTGPFYNTGSFNAVYAYRMQMLEPVSTSWRFDTEVAGGSKTLYTANQLPGVPRQTDVRKGTQYNFGLTGSLEMPDPTTVKSGVAVDNTTGSAILTAQDLFGVLTQDIVTTGSIGVVLDNAATVQTTAATISTFKV